jgi:hypothetical protein
MRLFEDGVLRIIFEPKRVGAKEFGEICIKRYFIIISLHQILMTY